MHIQLLPTMTDYEPKLIIPAICPDEELNDLWIYDHFLFYTCITKDENKNTDAYVKQKKPQTKSRIITRQSSSSE